MFLVVFGLDDHFCFERPFFYVPHRARNFTGLKRNLSTPGKQYNKDRPPLPEIPPIPMKTPFTSEELQAAIKKVQNNKSAGRDDIKEELL